MRLKRVILLVSLVIFAHNLSAFDCKKAETASEKLICQEEKLIIMDDALNLVYTTLLSQLSEKDKQIIIRDQKKWLNDRNKAVDSAGDELSNIHNVLGSYQKRIIFFKSKL